VRSGSSLVCQHTDLVENYLFGALSVRTGDASINGPGRHRVTNESNPGRLLKAGDLRRALLFEVVLIFQKTFCFFTPRSTGHGAGRRNHSSFARRAAWHDCGRAKASAKTLMNCSPRSTAGSPKAATVADHHLSSGVQPSLGRPPTRQLARSQSPAAATAFLTPQRCKRSTTTLTSRVASRRSSLVCQRRRSRDLRRAQSSRHETK
jgi:hypothetical protein